MTDNLQNLPKQHTPQEVTFAEVCAPSGLLADDLKHILAISSAFMAITENYDKRHTDEHAAKEIGSAAKKLWREQEWLDTTIKNGGNVDRQLTLSFCLQAVNDTLTEVYR